ncbi:hypothetical protein FB451DRAFT_1385465 [Mycena latifolia]|nr:hypothetical protein FB451DRAFT_1385465 [Mycena latifolia]
MSNHRNTSIYFIDTTWVVLLPLPYVLHTLRDPLPAPLLLRPAYRLAGALPAHQPPRLKRRESPTAETQAEAAVQVGGQGTVAHGGKAQGKREAARALEDSPHGFGQQRERRARKRGKMEEGTEAPRGKARAIGEW